jgi:hypothetical protein
MTGASPGTRPRASTTEGMSMKSTQHAGRMVGFALAMALAGSMGCAVPPDQEQGERPDEVATTQSAVSVCNQFGLPDPGTCSSCNADAAGHWFKTCVTIECNFAHIACDAPIVSCGACTYRFPGPSFTAWCTRADGTQVTQACTPPRLPPSPLPRLPW